MPVTNLRSVSVSGLMKVLLEYRFLLSTKKTVYGHGSVLNFDLYHHFFHASMQLAFQHDLIFFIDP